MKASRTGDPGLEFWGNSFVADPFGQMVAEASNDKEEILVVECDPAKSEDNLPQLAVLHIVVSTLTT